MVWVYTVKILKSQNGLGLIHEVKEDIKNSFVENEFIHFSSCIQKIKSRKHLRAAVGSEAQLSWQTPEK